MGLNRQHEGLIMPRPQKLRNPRAIVAHVEAEIKEEIDAVRGKLSYGDFLTALWKREKDYATLLAEKMNLELENQELKKRIEELEKLVEKLESQLRTARVLSKEEREFEAFKSKVHRVFENKSSMKMLEFLRELGYAGSADQLKSHAKTILKKYFEQSGAVFVSHELGLMILPDDRFAELAWIVRRMSHSFRGVVEVET